MHLYEPNRLDLSLSTYYRYLRKAIELLAIHLTRRGSVSENELAGLRRNMDAGNGGQAATDIPSR